MSNKYSRSTVNGVRDYTHRHIAAAILGRPLKGEEQVHHVDGNNFNNENSNLIICPNSAYHKLLHKRAEAYDACGDVSYRQCYICKAWCDIATMTFIERGKDSFYYHKGCATDNYHRNKARILANRRARRAAGSAN